MTLRRSSSTILLTGLFASFITAAGQTIFKTPLSPRIVTYKISVSLDPVEKMLRGHEIMTWRNTSNDAVRELQLHLYLNAFKNSQSSFQRELERGARDLRPSEGGWGWIDVVSVTTGEGEDLAGRMQFIHPDDDNDKDQSVMRLPLSKAVKPGQTILLDLDFRARLPRILARTGYYQNYYMVGQWYPKFGVYEAAGQRYAVRGQWNCHQFHANTEFYADYGVFDVAMTVPREYVVGATGLLQGEHENTDGTKTVSYHAEDVHDFAWTASPSYLDLHEQWGSVNIRVLMQPQRAHQTERYFESARAALAYFDRYVGKYPYPNLTIVDPAYGAFAAGGMEYPTLITAGSLWGIGRSIRYAEAATIHEFGHQYWYGIVGNNEFEDAWLDEGINQYYETRIMDETYGTNSSMIRLPGVSVGDFEMAREGYTNMRNPKAAPTATFAWKFRTRSEYGALTYYKSAVFLRTLERLIGRPVMDSIMKTYFERWKYKHPSGSDFTGIFNELAPKLTGYKYGKDMNWYFDQVLHGTDVCDYELTLIGNELVRRPQGVYDDAGHKTPFESAKDTNRTATLYDSRVVASRLGEIRLPTSVLVHFDNGREIREPWDGQARVAEFKYRTPEKIVWAMVDPDTTLLLDINLANNSKTEEPARAPIWKYTLKFLFWFQNVLQLSGMI